MKDRNNDCDVPYKRDKNHIEKNGENQSSVLNARCGNKNKTENISILNYCKWFYYCTGSKIIS